VRWASDTHAVRLRDDAAGEVLTHNLMRKKTAVIPYAKLQTDAEREGRQCVVGAVIRDGGGRIFVHRRSWDRALFPGCWDIVGGHVEPGEGLPEALAREVMEETGWSLAGIRQLLVVMDWEATADRGGTPEEPSVRRYREFDFLVDVGGDLARPRLEEGKQIEFRWIGPDDVGVLSENRGVDQGLVARIVRRAFELP
jgi:8-oxo-dGTP diphosphatase